MLGGLGVDLVQGYFYARPMTAAALERHPYLAYAPSFELDASVSLI
jgi:EAL domain-containing protein (putative c-di-GMP-specific phosphodiesterase class I)